MWFSTDNYFVVYTKKLRRYCHSIWKHLDLKQSEILLWKWCLLVLVKTARLVEKTARFVYSFHSNTNNQCQGPIKCVIACICVTLKKTFRNTAKSLWFSDGRVHAYYVLKYLIIEWEVENLETNIILCFLTSMPCSSYQTYCVIIFTKAGRFF